MRPLPTLAGLLFLIASAAPSTSAQAPGRTEPLAVYLDCRTGCDGDLFRTEITWVNWVRDRTVADVHLLVTSQGAGAGGEQFTFAFLGSRSFASRGDTLTFTTNPTTTSDERRRGMMQTIAVGLVQFAAHTPAGRTLRVLPPSATPGQAQSQTVPASDPWKAWVFEIGVNGSMDGEELYRGRNVHGSFGARRVTEEWKTNFEYSFSYRDNRATVQEFDSLGNPISSETFTNLQRNWDGQLLQVKSLTERWSLAGYLEVGQQTFRNQALRVDARTGVEFNIFPYSESTRREFTFRYGLGMQAFRYRDTTVFDKIEESMPIHFFEATYRTRQPWGNVNVDFSHRNFLTDASKRSTELNGNFNVRIYRGLSFNAGGGYEWIHDQVYLPRGQQDAVDVFLRRRALLTGYQYYTHFGISYTFGSIYNNVVNPRF